MSSTPNVDSALDLAAGSAAAPKGFRTHGCANFWFDHGCPRETGTEINVKMRSGRTAVFRLAKSEPALDVDWWWYDFEFVRYLPLPNSKQ